MNAANISQGLKEPYSVFKRSLLTGITWLLCVWCIYLLGTFLSRNSGDASFSCLQSVDWFHVVSLRLVHPHLGFRIKPFGGLSTCSRFEEILVFYPKKKTESCSLAVKWIFLYVFCSCVTEHVGQIFWRHQVAQTDISCFHKKLLIHSRNDMKWTNERYFN